MLTLTFFWIYLGAFFNAPAAQDINYVYLERGSCWDGTTGVDLPATVYAVVANKKTKLGVSDSKGILSFKIPTNAQSLIFESEGFVSITKKVYFIRTFSSRSKFNMTVPMEKIGAAVVKQSAKEKYNRNPETAIFCIPASHRKGMEYELFRAKNRFLITNFSLLMDVGHGLNTDIPPNHYLLVVKLKNGQQLMEKDLFIKDGLNFIDLHVEKQNEEAPQPISSKPAKETETVFDNRNLYFDQSKYELKAEAKLTLDSASAYLLNHAKTKILLIGHTDNVGSREPNVILSEYRARAVAGYLQKKGVNANQITVKWDGPNYQLKANAKSGDVGMNRRVVIEIIEP